MANKHQDDFHRLLQDEVLNQDMVQNGVYMKAIETIDPEHRDILWKGNKVKVRMGNYFYRIYVEVKGYDFRNDMVYYYLKDGNGYIRLLKHKECIVFSEHRETIIEFPLEDMDYLR